MPKAIANAFNNFFAKIGNDIANSVPSRDCSPQKYFNKQTYDTFYLFPTSTSEIETEISAINVRKATGPYSIPSNLLKLLKSVISKPLEIIFNASFAGGNVPNKFKIARVLPVFKNGIQTNMSDYRPISLLSVFNRILEKIMYNRLSNFIEKMNIQGPRSRGGWGGFSPPNNFPKFDLKKLNIVILKIMWLHTLLIMQWS